jgi:hypothetical protein
MDGRKEQTAVIKICFKACLSATETLVSVQKAYGNEGLKQSNVFTRYAQFQGDGRELVNDDKRGAHLKSTQTEVNIAAVADLLKNDSNHIKNDSRIFEHPQDCSSLDSEREFLLSRFFLLHNNEPAHIAASVCQFLT